MKKVFQIVVTLLIMAGMLAIVIQSPNIGIKFLFGCLLFVATAFQLSLVFPINNQKRKRYPVACRSRK